MATIRTPQDVGALLDAHPTPVGTLLRCEHTEYPDRVWHFRRNEKTEGVIEAFYPPDHVDVDVDLGYLGILPEDELVCSVVNDADGFPPVGSDVPR